MKTCLSPSINPIKFCPACKRDKHDDCWAGAEYMLHLTHKNCDCFTCYKAEQFCAKPAIAVCTTCNYPVCSEHRIKHKEAHKN